MTGKTALQNVDIHTNSAVSGKSVLILGATGATGQFLLQELLNCSAYSRVGEYGRRVTPLDEITSGKEKIIQKVIDFENLSESGIKEGRWDVVLITYVHLVHTSRSWLLGLKIIEYLDV